MMPGNSVYVENTNEIIVESELAAMIDAPTPNDPAKASMLGKQT